MRSLDRLFKSRLNGTGLKPLVQYIKDLFSNNEQGAWYDPSDMSTLYQDAAGTIPVTAVEQPVGLMLDKSKGLVRGPELVANGDFSQGATGWTTGTGWSISNELVGSSVPAYTVATKAISVIAGKSYEVQYTVTSFDSGQVRANFIGGTQVNGIVRTAVGSYREVLVANTGNTLLAIGSGGTGFTGSVDNISVRELPGNHASQITATSRPVLSARVNLLTKTEQLSNAAWSKSAIGAGVVPDVTDNFGIAPNGTQTASRVQLSVGSGTATSDISYLTQVVSNSLPSTGRVYMRLNTGASKLISLRVGAKIEQKTVTSEWQEFSVSDSTGNRMDILLYGNAGGGTADLLVWHPDLRPTNTGTNLPNYQRVNTATDYDTVGFPAYLKFDGTDDWLATPSIDFTGTDKMMVCAGVRKLSNATAGILVELGNASPGAFWFGAPGNASTEDIFNFSDVGGSRNVRLSTAAPITGVYSSRADFGAKTIAGRINTNPMVAVGSFGSGGTYGNYPLYIGRRAGTSLPFNGHLYGLIIRGAATSDSQIKSVERYVNTKTRAYTT